MDIELVNAAINGDRRSLARTLSGIENGLVKLEQIRQIVTHSSKSHQENVWTSLAITGAPGVGKSCLIDKLLKIWASKLSGNSLCTARASILLDVPEKKIECMLRVRAAKKCGLLKTAFGISR